MGRGGAMTSARGPRKSLSKLSHRCLENSDTTQKLWCGSSFSQTHCSKKLLPKVLDTWLAYQTHLRTSYPARGSDWILLVRAAPEGQLQTALISLSYCPAAVWQSTTTKAIYRRLYLGLWWQRLRVHRCRMSWQQEADMGAGAQSCTPTSANASTRERE